jgi:hypothetical protein
VKSVYWIGGFLVVAMGVAGYWLGGAGGIVDRGDDWRDDRTRQIEADAPCTLDETGCRFSMGGLTVSVRAQDTIRPLEPFRVYLETTVHPQIAEVRFTMDDMDMGINRFRFAPVSENLWETTAVLPVCTIDRADWRATFRVKLDEENYRMDVMFEAGR